MKKSLLVVTVLFLTISGFSQGITFEKGSFNEILAKAKKENKQIFVDVFTEWCGPCKTLSENVFPDPELGKLYNSKFISFKLNAEKGEGVELAKKFQIKAYPTLLFLNNEGNVIQRVIGSRSIEELMEEADKIDGYLKNGSPEMYLQQYTAGERGSKFLLQYYKMCGDDQKPVVINEYLMSLPDDQLFNVDNKQFENIKMYDSKLFTRLVDGLVARNSKDLAFNFSVTFPVQYLLSVFLEQSIANGDLKTYQEILTLKKKAVILNISKDEDYLLRRGRGIFFASDEYVNLLYQVKNNKDVNEKKALIRDYIENFVVIYPKDTLKKELFINEATPKELYYFVVPGVINSNSFSTLFLLDCVDYYWCKSETNKAVISDCSRWCNYFFDINQLNYEVAFKAANILYRINRPKEAIAMLKKAIDCHVKYNEKQVNVIESLRNRLQDIENKK